MSAHRFATALRRIALAAVVLGSSAAQALGIGEISLQSSLGEPLRAVVPLGSVGSLTADQIVVGRASEEVHRTYGVDRASYTAPLRFALEVDEKGNASVRVSSEQPVGEPFVDLVLEVRWPTGRSVKHFTILLDPGTR